MSFKCPFIDEQLAVQSCVSLTKLFLVRKIATSSPAFEKCTTIIFFSEKFLWKHERVVFAKIFVRIEITEQKSSPTKTSSLIKIFGWSIFENTVKHARKKGLSLKTAFCSPLGRHWSLAKDNCLKNVCCVKLFSKEGTWKGCSKAWFSRQWFDGWSAALCQTLLVQQLDNHFTRPRPCPIVAFHFSSEQLQGVQEKIVGHFKKHRRNCKNCQSQVTWKVKFKWEFCPVLSWPQDHHVYYDQHDHHDRGNHEVGSWKSYDEVGGCTQGSWRLSDLI